MAAIIAEEIRTYLTELISVQAELSNLNQSKFQALSEENTGQIQKLTLLESKQVNRLKEMTEEREQFLARANQAGISINSIREFISRLPETENEGLMELIEKSTQLTLHLRQQSWKQWVYIQRSHQHNSEILELIAHRGVKSPTYDENSPQGANGGVVLDASA